MMGVAELRPYLDAHFTKTLFRLEALAAYNVASEGPDFARYLAGEPGPTLERRQPWLDRLRAEVSRGQKRRRVHAVTLPLADYLRFECEWGYALNPYEGIRILELSAKRPDLQRLVDSAGGAYQPNIILGVLQTAAYAEVVFSSRGRTASQTAHGVARRLARQAALTEPGRNWVLIQAEQVYHIIEASLLPNVRVGLIIRRTPTTILASHGFHIFDARAAQIGTKTAVALIDNAEDIATYEALFSELEQMAVFGDDVRAELHRIADEYRRAPCPAHLSSGN